MPDQVVTITVVLKPPTGPTAADVAKFDRALHALKVAVREVQEAWEVFPGDAVCDYPTYLPDWGQFVLDVEEMELGLDRLPTDEVERRLIASRLLGLLADDPAVAQASTPLVGAAAASC